MSKEYVLCAAIWFDDGIEYVHQPVKTGLVICGRRHHNCFYTVYILKPELKMVKHTEGFLTSKNRFLDRSEAARLALESGQIKEDIVTLLSEDLY